MKRIFLLGYPSNVGGACTEAWHLLQLFRQAGVDCILIPTWGRADPKWQPRCDAIGCHTLYLPHIRGGIRNVPDLPGSVVVGMCNEAFFAVYRELVEMQCQIVWLNCMTHWYEYELKHFNEFGWPTHI